MRLLLKPINVIYPLLLNPRFASITVLKSEVTCVRDDYVFATSESYPAIGHVREVEYPPLRFSDTKHLKLKDLWHGATKTEFKRLLDLKPFAFGVKVPRGSYVVSVR